MLCSLQLQDADVIVAQGPEPEDSATLPFAAPALQTMFTNEAFEVMEAALAATDSPEGKGTQLSHPRYSNSGWFATVTPIEVFSQHSSVQTCLILSCITLSEVALDRRTRCLYMHCDAQTIVTRFIKVAPDRRLHCNDANHHFD